MNKLIAFLAGVIVGAVGIVDIACIVAKSDNKNATKSATKTDE